MDFVYKRELPADLVGKIDKLTETHGRGFFAREYTRKRKSAFSAYVISIIFSPIFMFLYLGKTGLFFAFLAVTLLTAGIGGIIWYLIEIFLIAGRVREHNENAAYEIIRRMRDVN